MNVDFLRTDVGRHVADSNRQFEVEEYPVGFDSLHVANPYLIAFDRPTASLTTLDPVDGHLRMCPARSAIDEIRNWLEFS